MVSLTSHYKYLMRLSKMQVITMPLYTLLIVQSLSDAETQSEIGVQKMLQAMLYTVRKKGFHTHRLPLYGTPTSSVIVLKQCY